MPTRNVTWDSFDIWHLPRERDSRWIETRCQEAVTDRFESRFGRDNIQVNAFATQTSPGPGWYTIDCPECFIVEHSLTRKWAVWNTNDHASWVLFDSIFRRYGDSQRYPAGYWTRKPRDLVRGLLTSMSWPAWREHLRAKHGGGLDAFYEDLSFEEWSDTGPFRPAPYPGQTLKPEVADEVYAEEPEPMPYAVFRGFYWQERMPFIRHLHDIVDSRRLREIVLVCTKGNESVAEPYRNGLNIDSLPDFAAAKPQSELPYRDYLRELATASACLSLPGCHDICRREQEALGVGCPVIRPDYTHEIWGCTDPRAAIRTRRCTEYRCHRDVNWRIVDDELVRQSCEEMVDRALELCASREQRAARGSAGRQWYEEHCNPENVAEYVFASMIEGFTRELTGYHDYAGALDSPGMPA